MDKQKLKRLKSEYEESSLLLNENTTSRVEGGLLDFSDDVLLHTLKYLNTADILNLRKTCKRLEYLCRDRTLWERVDSRPTRLTMAQTKETLTLVRPKAVFLAIRGQAHVHDEKLPCQFFVELSSKCFTLETLILEDCYFSAQEVALKDFPSSVKYLSLRGCVLTQLNPARSFFSGIQDHMPNIETIVLSNCDWFPAHSIMPLSKCSRLKELRLDGIASVVNNVAYFSLATKFGFQALEVLDLRNTVVGGPEISCFHHTASLTHLYLECPEEHRHPDPRIPVCFGTRTRIWRSVVEDGAGPSGLGSSTDPDIVDGSCVIVIDLNSIRNGVVQLHHHPYCSHRMTNEDGEIPPELQNPQRPNDRMFNCNNVEYFEHHMRSYSQYAITDISIISLLAPKTIRDNIELGNVRDGDLEGQGEEQEGGNILEVIYPRLHTLVLRHYTSITDNTLIQIAKLDSLRFLDVTGTSVTEKGVNDFTTIRPEVELISHFEKISLP
uniref:F-box domain-containing protein n=1 Tax=Timema genevievae TaxID=629358 RepID=A0A7R9JYI2_TIMGE|nr:unnamed protein product [Timema genevievae]